MAPDYSTSTNTEHHKTGCQCERCALHQFEKTLIENQVPLDPDLRSLLDEHYWDMLA